VFSEVTEEFAVLELFSVSEEILEEFEVFATLESDAFLVSSLCLVALKENKRGFALPSHYKRNLFWDPFVRHYPALFLTPGKGTNSSQSKFL